MAFDELLADRMRRILHEKEVAFTEKQMFSGICFFVDDKMCCGTHIDKKSGENFVLCRVGESAGADALENGGCIPMDFTGKSMKGYVFATEPGILRDPELAHWLQLCLDFNPQAKKSKK